MDPTKIVAEIADGRLDGHLFDLLSAVQLRVVAGATAFLWKIEWDDLTVTEEDITLGELVVAERIAGRNWSQLNPSTSAGNCRAVLIATLMNRRDMSEEKATAKVDAQPVHTLLDSIGQYEVSPAPFEDGTGTPDST